jgi:hypothetical protein
MVLKRILTGRWRSSYDRRPGVEACLDLLRTWARSGTDTHPVSGVGMWADDIPTDHVRLDTAEQDALDHVATPLGPADVDTGKTLRRFIHRAIRKNLVAQYVARLPVDEAADALRPHLWFDRDWKYTAPVALVMHPERDHAAATNSAS